MLYVLDEPSIGLHQRDNDRLLATLRRLRDLDNTVIVVEHDEEAIRSADYLVDMGPGAGVHGGHVVAEGLPEEVVANGDGLTAQYLTGRRRIEIPHWRRPGNGHRLVVAKAHSGHNLQRHRRRLPARRVRLRHRRFRRRQIHPGGGNALQGAR